MLSYQFEAQRRICIAEMLCTPAPFSIGQSIDDGASLKRRGRKIYFFVDEHVEYDCQDEHFVMDGGRRSSSWKSTCEVNAETGLLEWSPLLDAEPRCQGAFRVKYLKCFALETKCVIICSCLLMVRFCIIF